MGSYIKFILGIKLLMSSILISAQSQELSSGILLGGGAGTLDYEFVTPLHKGQIGRQFDDTYNYDLHIGYRFRVPQGNRFFWDLDALLGIKSIQKGTLLDFSEVYVQYQTERRHLNYYLAFSPSFNVNIYKGLFAGVGFEPTWYFYRAKDNGMGFDLPAVVRIGYDFGKFSLEGSAKFGLMRHSVTDLLEKNRRKEFQLSLYVPLSSIINRK